MLRFGSEPVGERIKKIVLRKRGFFFFYHKRMMRKRAGEMGRMGKWGKRKRRSSKPAFFLSHTSLVAVSEVFLGCYCKGNRSVGGRRAA